ncbi:MAG: M3 family metallopeptidase [Muribaculaceae bacterium]|nr:M3 family metallopeptidase [Muribaculaceae bacterium]
MKKLSLILLLAVICVALSATGATKKKVKQQNPFLAAYTTKYGIPPFEKIKYEHYLPALQAGIEQQNQQISEIVNNTAAPTFDNTVLALDNSGEILNKVEYVFAALVESDNTPQMHELAEQLMPMFTAQSDEIMMNEALFARIKAVHDQAATLGLTPVQQRLTEKYYKRMVRNGALLDAALKDTLKEINRREAELQLAFNNNVMQEIANNIIWVSDKAQLAGLSQATIDDAAKLAEEKGKQGQWAFTASGATRLAVLGDADSRELRQKMYQTYTATGSRGNQWDNSDIINQLIRLRQRKAQLLGYVSFADYAIDPVMAHTVERAEDLLMQIWRPAVKKVHEEVADMQAYANAHGGSFSIEPWDYYYYAAKVKQEKYNFSEEQVRPYFELKSVVNNGIFYLANRLYGITFTEMKDAPKYNPEVTVYDVRDAQGKHLAVFMTDYYPRATKAQGAWMSEFCSEYNYEGQSVRPIVFNVASFNPPTKDAPSLLSIDQVETLFHEFGHALQGMLTTAPFRGLSGTNVDRDLVEMPSQLNEHWAYEPEILKNYARHYLTGEVIPQELVDKILESSKFNQGFMTTELVGAALLDIEWHKLNWCDSINVEKFERSVARRLGMPREVQFRYRSPYFKHIFDNAQYSCGYYTYLLAQVLEADAWERFRTEGPLNLDVAKDYRQCILEPGDSEDPMKLFVRFRGQEPNADALLRNRGLK